MFKPQLMHKDGKLFVHLSLDGLFVMRPTPENFQNYSQDALRVFFEAVVPSMKEELLKLKKDNEKKFKRKAKDASSKSRGHVKGRHLRAVE